MATNKPPQVTGGASAQPPAKNPARTPSKPTSATVPAMQWPTSNIYLSFYGADIGTGTNVQQFQAMMGDNPPTIIPGLPIWNEVQRPLMRSVLIAAGYNLAQMKVDLRFGQWPNGAWDASDKGGQQTETDLEALDMMSGSAGYYEYGIGHPQIVYVAAWANGGGFSDVIPRRYQYAPYSGQQLFPWVISELTYNTAYRNANGYRVFQEVSMTLKQYLFIADSSNSMTTPPSSTPLTTVSGGWFTASKARNTAQLIAADPSSRSPNQDHNILAARIVAANGMKGAKGTINPIGLKTTTQKITPGIKVWVPSHTEY